MGNRKSTYSVPFPDLSCDKPSVAPVSNVIPSNGFKHTKEIAVPKGFVVMNSHKQGDMIHPVKDLKYLGGKKQ